MVLQIPGNVYGFKCYSLEKMKDRWTDGWKDGWMDGWMDGWRRR